MGKKKKEKEADPLKAFLNQFRGQKPKMILDDWKRQYSNPPGGKSDNYSAMPFFRENYNPEEYSLFMQDFKYQEENKIGFMQILDDSEAKGYYRLKGVWLFQGTDIKIMELANRVRNIQLDKNRSHRPGPETACGGLLVQQL